MRDNINLLLYIEDKLRYSALYNAIDRKHIYKC